MPSSHLLCRYIWSRSWQEPINQKWLGEARRQFALQVPGPEGAFASSCVSRSLLGGINAALKRMETR